MQQENQCLNCNGTGVEIDAEQLRFKRLRKGKPAKVVAIDMGISAAYLSDLEHGHRKWNASLLARFEKALKI